jgi:hypothetical protein
LCSQPLLENEPRRLIGQRFHGIQEIEPSLRETSGGMLVTERGRYASGTYHKPSWQPTLRSREKALYLVVELGENAGETRVEKVLDVLFVVTSSLTGAARHPSSRLLMAPRSFTTKGASSHAPVESAESV